ncbi:MAG: flippase [Caldilineaceae bacterium]|nr:flippase [Caldilineaceae bacterium]
MQQNWSGKPDKVNIANSFLASIRGQNGTHKTLVNTSWLIFEKLISLGIGLLVSVLVARYVGPENYGFLSYALSVISFLSTFVYLGLSGLVVRDIVRSPAETDTLLGTTFLLKSAGSVFAFLMVVGLAFFTNDAGDTEFWILLIIGFTLFARPFETIDFWFQAQIQSKYTVIARTIAFITGAVLKVLFVMIGASVVAIAIASSLQFILVSVFLIFIYHYRGLSIWQWKARVSKAKELLSQSWIVVFAGFFALVNLKADQIMLRWMSGAGEVGIYSVAVTFSEIWYFIPAAIAMSVFPKLIDLKKSSSSTPYERHLQQVFDILFVLAFSVALMMSFLASPFIYLLYGEAYAGSAAILTIHVWAGIFVFMQQITNKWVLMENVLLFHLANHGTAALLNLVLNGLLIPKYGGLGAAVSTLISYSASSYFFLFLYPKTRTLATKISRAYIFPLRLLVFRTNIWD